VKLIHRLQLVDYLEHRQPIVWIAKTHLHFSHIYGSENQRRSSPYKNYGGIARNPQSFNEETLLYSIDGNSNHYNWKLFLIGVLAATRGCSNTGTRSRCQFPNTNLDVHTTPRQHRAATFCSLLHTLNHDTNTHSNRRTRQRNYFSGLHASFDSTIEHCARPRIVRRHKSRAKRAAVCPV